MNNDENVKFQQNSFQHTNSNEFSNSRNTFEILIYIYIYIGFYFYTYFIILTLWKKNKNKWYICQVKYITQTDIREKIL